MSMALRIALVGLVLLGPAQAALRTNAAQKPHGAAGRSHQTASARAPTGLAGQARPVTPRAKIHPVGTPRAVASGGPAALRAAASDRIGTPNRTRGAGAGTLGGPAAYDARKGAVLQGTGFKRRH